MKKKNVQKSFSSTEICFTAGLRVNHSWSPPDSHLRCLPPLCGPGFSPVKSLNVAELTWEGKWDKGDAWLPALLSASGCAPPSSSSLLTQRCQLLNRFPHQSGRKLATGSRVRHRQETPLPTASPVCPCGKRKPAGREILKNK